MFKLVISIIIILAVIIMVFINKYPKIKEWIKSKMGIK
jgi:hypothetical protein